MAACTSSTMYRTLAWSSCAVMVEPPSSWFGPVSFAGRGEDGELIPDPGVELNREVLEDGAAGVVVAARRRRVGDAPVDAPRVMGKAEPGLTGSVAQRDHLVEPTPGKRVEMPWLMAGDV